jgi:hypothetical protein
VGYRLVTAAWHLSRLTDRVRLTAFTLLAACDPATACGRVPTPQALTVIASTITAAAVLVTVRPLRGRHRPLTLMAGKRSVTQRYIRHGGERMSNCMPSLDLETAKSVRSRNDLLSSVNSADADSPLPFVTWSLIELIWNGSDYHLAQPGSGSIGSAILFSELIHVLRLLREPAKNSGVLVEFDGTLADAGPFARRRIDHGDCPRLEQVATAQCGSPRV